jgi:hypothetical protein
MPAPFGRRPLPQQDHGKLMLLAQRYQAAAAGHAIWAEKATECVNFREGRQYTPKQLADLRGAGRPALVYNEISSISRLVEGYFSENRIDTIYSPGQDMISTDQTAQALSMVRKQISQANDEPDVDADVFLDGLLTGRGLYDVRRSYKKNRLGDCQITAKDPFRLLIDPTADKYDSDAWGYTIYAPLLSLDEIQHTYGVEASELVAPLAMGQTPTMPIGMMPLDTGTVPVRGFGSYDGDTTGWLDQYFGMLGDFADPYRRQIRVLDFEYWVSVPGYVFIDLDTGESKPVPEFWNQDKIARTLHWANEIEGAHVDVVQENIRKVRWTTVVGDLIVYDAWSSQPHLSTVGFFPYFRWGKTMGMIEDLIDPSREANKNRSNLTDIIARSANSGWKYADDTFTPAQERNLKKFGAAPGVNIPYRAGKTPPERIQPADLPTGLERLVQEGSSKLNDISGVSKAAMGQLDVVQSGKAYLSRTRQTVVGIQPYFANHKRSKRAVGRNTLDLIQNTYTERRIIRVVGEGTKLAQAIVNDEQVDPTTGLTSKLNDLTRGQFVTVVDDQPISATFADGQFQETLGVVDRVSASPIALQFGDLIVEASAMANKEEWKKRFQQIQAGMGIGGQPQAPGAPGAPGMPPQGGQPMLPPAAAQGTEPPAPATAAAPSNVIPLAR